MPAENGSDLLQTPKDLLCGSPPAESKQLLGSLIGRYGGGAFARSAAASQVLEDVYICSGNEITPRN